MEEWKLYKLSDVTNLIGDGIHGTPKYDDSGSYFFINGNNLENGKIVIRSTTKKVNTEEALKHRKSLSERTILVSINGTIGNTARYNFEPCILGKSACYLNVSDGVDVDFIYYVVSNQQFKDTITRLATGTTIKNVSLETMRNYEFLMPSLKSQKKISGILKSIDDKIELNRQINDNLEQQASSILSDWTSTYPCRTYKLSDICKYVSAKCDTGNLTSQNYISTENMLPNKKGIVDASNIPTGKVTCFKVDDILIANIRPYFQKIWKADTSGGCSTDVLCIRSCVESHSPILYWILHQDAFFEYVMTGAKGCKMPRGDKQHIMNWTIDLPEPDYWADIATQLGAVDQRIAYNRIESNNLSNLRDTLLPKLMSGELKINEIDC